MENQDSTWLQKYQASGSEQAFAELVSQYVGLVYSAALRQVGEPELAKEICQLVFIKLSEKAPTLDSRTILSGWLCRTTRFICADHLKARYRRERREKEYAMQNFPTEPAAESWENLSPCLDAALAELALADQDLLTLRFFEKKPFASIGLALGINEAAAKMRVARALEKLRTSLAAKGVALTFATLAALLMDNAVRAVPPEILAQILNHLKSSTPAPQLAKLHRLPLRGAAVLTAMSVILLLSLVGVILHASRASREAMGSLPAKIETAQKAGLDAGVDALIVDALQTTGGRTNASAVAPAISPPLLPPYVPQVFSEDTDDLKLILEYVGAQLPHITLGDRAGGVQTLQVGILGDSRYMTATDRASALGGPAGFKRATHLKDLDDCSVVLIAVDGEDQIREALTALASRPVITIGFRTNFLVWGGCINFITLDNLLGYGLNLDRARTIGCNFSDLLTNAAAELFENGEQKYRFAARPGDDTEREFFETKQPFLPKGFTRRMKRLAFSEAKREAVMDAWKQYPVMDTYVFKPNDMRAAMQEQQREIEALQSSGSMSYEGMKKIMDKFQARQDQAFSNVMGASIEFNLRMRETRPKRLALLAPVLTAEELFAYRFLLDSEVVKVANLMRVINLTPEELQRIAFIFDEREEGMFNGSFSPETEAILQQELGPVRYAQYQAAYSPAGRELALVVLKYSSPLAHRSFLGTTRLTPKRPY